MRSGKNWACGSDRKFLILRPRHSPHSGTEKDICPDSFLNKYISSMQKVYTRLHVGDESDCSPTGRDWTVVHACKFPCHREAVGYRKSPRKSHPHYLSKEDGNHLYLNMIDPERPLFQMEMFEDFFSFAKRWSENEDRILIHCNQGRSRSPSLALLLLAAHTDEVPTGSYAEARQVFEELYPMYQPSGGIKSYLDDNWTELLKLP